VITLDTTRRDALSVYGAATPTPNIAAFAEHAVVYDHAIAAAPWTLPSHASIFTGLFPSRHGAGVRDEHLARSIPTLAERFREHGYRTAGFVGGALAASQWGIARGFQTYVDPAGWEVRGDRLTDDVIAFLEAAKGEPVFVFANYFDAHSSYRAPEPFRSQLDLPAKEAAVASHPEFGPLSRGDNSPWSRVVDGKTEITDAAIDWITAAYHAEVAYLDHQLGRLLGTLKRLDLYDRALIVLVADHGEFLGEHGFFSHSCRLDAELIDIPLLIKWPHQSSGRRSADLVSHVDLFPTLLETLAERPDGIDGIAVAQRRDRAAARPPALFEEHEFRIHPFFEYMKIDAHLYGRQEPTFREVVWKDGASCERRNDGVWQDADCRQAPDRLLAELSAQLLGPNPPVDALASGPQPASPELTNSRESGMTPEQLENLRALGYVPE
jgi:arylsulfatase A-like enzyme